MNRPTLTQTTIFNASMGFIAGFSYLFIPVIVFAIYLGWISTGRKK